MRHKLKPALYLMLQVLKTTLWSVLFVLSSVGMAQIAGRAMDSDVPTALVAGFVQVLIVLYVYPASAPCLPPPLKADLTHIQLSLSFLATLIYGSVIYHRARRALRAHASAHVEDGIPASAPALALAPAPSPVFEMAGKSNTSNFSSPRQREHELEVQQQHQHQTSPEMRHENKVW